MKIFSADGNDLPSGAPFEHNGIAYPWNWFDLASDEDLAAHGFEVREVPTPSSDVKVTRRQARLALYTFNLLEQVEAAVDAEGGTTKISWDNAAEITRHDALVVALAAALGLTDEQLDDLFAFAVTL
jgi:hypothetical protein